MAQPTDTTCQQYDKADNPMLADQQAAITAASVAHTIADTAETVDRSDIEAKLDALGTAVNSLISAMEAHGLIADN
jgi:hypothetical protein